jgi:hypothetical protein
MKNIKHRLLFPMQAKGNVGKSLEIATRACWLSERGIEWQGFDLDADNRTLSRLFPGEVQLVPMTGRADDQDELVSILKKVTAKPVTIMDARAHLDGVLRTALQATRFFNLAKQLNIGITVTMFPLDDVDVMTNLDELCQFCGSQVEYIVVKNPARAARTKMFDGSPLDDELKALGATIITLPLLSEIVKMNLAFLETKHERGIPFNEAIGSDELGLDIMARGMLQDWTGQMFNQYDRIAGRLLPTAEAEKIKPKAALALGEPPRARRGAKVNFAQ